MLRANCLQIEITLLAPVKDTANPLSHHVTASLIFFNHKQALAPVKVKSKIRVVLEVLRAT